MKAKSRIIGDPFKKFKRPSVVQDCHPQLRKILEKIMEEDHRAGRPLSTAVMTSPRSGLPDQWFFEKAKSLGYQFDDPMVFWMKQCEEFYASNVEGLPSEQIVEKVEASLRKLFGEELWEKTVISSHGSIEEWRAAAIQDMEDAAARGGNFGKELSKRKVHG